MASEGLRRCLGTRIGTAGLDIGMAKIGDHGLHRGLENLRAAGVIKVGPTIVEAAKGLAGEGKGKGHGSLGSSGAALGDRKARTAAGASEPKKRAAGRGVVS